MPNSNTTVNITSDGSVISYDRHGVRIHELSGTYPMLHVILKLNSLSSKNRLKLPDVYKIRAEFFFIREDTVDVIPLPLNHVMSMVKYVIKKDSEEFVQNLLLQIPQD
jgi:hypothetical protein